MLNVAYHQVQLMVILTVMFKCKQQFLLYFYAMSGLIRCDSNTNNSFGLLTELHSFNYIIFTSIRQIL